MKHEWRKKEKGIYLPKEQPEIIDIPSYQFISLKGQGNPNSTIFSEHIGVLYSLAYAIKMNLKSKVPQPVNYTDWTVYPLEGVWDITEKAKQNFTGVINKDGLVFDLMIRQPEFITQDFFNEMLELTKKKKPHKLLNHVTFESRKEGRCVQMLHIGSYDNEHISFEQMEIFAQQKNEKRKSKTHREIYLSDFRKVTEEKLKTVLRFQLD